MSDLLGILNSEFKKLQSSERIGNSLAATSSFIKELESIYADIESQEEDQIEQATITNNLHSARTNWMDAIKKNTKTSNTTITKFGKSVLDQINDFQLSDAYIYKIDKTEMNLHLINNAIKLHLIRNGDMAVLNKTFVDDGYNTLRDGTQSDELILEVSHDNTFQKENNRIDLNLLNKFNEMNEIIHDIKQRKLERALKWSIENEDVLVGQFGSQLEFKLHRLQYLIHYHSGDTLATYHYGKIFRKFIDSNDKHLSTVSKLISSIIYDSENEQSPYYETNQLKDSEFQEIALLFSKEFCSVLGFAFESSIFTIVLSGIISAPFFMKFVQIKNLNNRLDWSSHDELPFEVSLPPFLRKFHPIFICPVSKEETTLNNPPMALPCHHIISKQSLSKLSRNGSSFKCPYCPTNAMASQCEQVTFYHI